MYARVLLDQKMDRELDYAIPEGMQGRIWVGSRVRVPLRQQLLLGTVLELQEQTQARGLREIHEVVGEEAVLSPVLLRMAQWISDYYCCPISAVVRSVLPNVIRRAEMSFKKQVFIYLTRSLADDERVALKQKSPKQHAVLEHLERVACPVLATELLAVCKANASSLSALVKKGLVEKRAEILRREPNSQDTFLDSPEIPLNTEQAQVFERVKQAIDDPQKHRPILLHGVTGSGKTEVYLQAIRYALQQNKNAIVMVPEIALTPQTVERFKSRFSDIQQQVAILHSNLSPGERHDEWHKIHQKQARIVIGARSAVFAPMAALGLIVVDEEHEYSYKQDEAPRYQGRDIAVLRASLEKCAVLLGSATPSLESFYNVTIGKYQLEKLLQRADDRQMPLIRVVDMRQQTRSRQAPSPLSMLLVSAIQKRLDAGEQTILFLNRRGFASAVICGACGYVCQCPNCSLALTYHQSNTRIACHLCGHTAVHPRRCPKCEDPSLLLSGQGTQKIEQAVSQLFKQAKVARMDTDTMVRKDSYREILSAFRSAKIDILVGTQMIAKGLHFPNVTLVGIINADTGLHMPDFRAGERTFQLLTQVAGRAGRGEVLGEVFVQTFTPFHPSIQFARHHDFAGFWEQESSFRKNCGYPPYTHMILLSLRSKHQQLASLTAESLARRLEKSRPEGVLLSPPAPAPLEKVAEYYRFHISLRGAAIRRMSRFVTEALSHQIIPQDVILSIDVDPYHLL